MNVYLFIYFLSYMTFVDSFAKKYLHFRHKIKDKKESNNTMIIQNNDVYNGECILPVTIKNIKINSGFDTRYNNSNSIDIYLIKHYFHKLNLLKVLENENVSVNTKLQLVDKYNLLNEYPIKYINNLYAGGLLDDWF